MDEECTSTAHGDTNDNGDDFGKRELMADLRAGIQATRLVRLLPGSDEARIAIALDYQRLDKAPPYTALSYTWKDTGDDGMQGARDHNHESQVFFHDGKTKHITAGLRDALFRIRQSDPDGVQLLWIDQLCIDQEDVEERGLQVDIMWAIFAKASRVVLWIGEHQQDTKQAFDLITRAARELVSSDQPVSDATDPMARMKNIARCGNPESWYSVIDHYRRPVLTRGWVVQELLLSERADIDVRCGSHCVQFISWLLTGLCLSNFGELGTKFVLYTIMRSSQRNRAVPAALMRNVFRQLISIDIFFQRGLPIPLSLLLVLGSAFETDDPRDRVFCLLNVHRASLKDGTPTIAHSDYTKTIPQTFTDATRRIIEAESSLNILETAGAAYASKYGLPSWVPDFSRADEDPEDGRKKYDQRDSFSTPRAAGDSDVSVDWPEESNFQVMQTQSYVLGRVTSIGEPFHMSSQGDENCSTRTMTSWVLTAGLATNVSYDTCIEAGKAFGRMFTRQKIPLDGLDAHDHWIACIIIQMMLKHDENSTSRLHDAAHLIVNYSQTSGGNFLDAAERLTDPMLHDLVESIGGVEGLFIPTKRKLNYLFIYFLQQEQTDLPGPNQGSFENFDDLAQAVANAMPPRNCFVLDSGHFGLGPVDVAVGDEVHVMKGAGTPYICRKDSSSALHDLIGKCDVPGVMDGQALIRPDFSFGTILFR